MHVITTMSDHFMLAIVDTTLEVMQKVDFLYSLAPNVTITTIMGKVMRILQNTKGELSYNPTFSLL